LGFCICAFIFWNLGRTAKIAGTIWLLIGMAYGAWRTRAFTLDLPSFEIAEETLPS